jgi:DNA mismatch repair protein MutS2
MCKDNSWNRDGKTLRVKIIHGIGTGRLSRAISDYLKDHPLVERSRKGEEREGGEAVTIVYL